MAYSIHIGQIIKDHVEKRGCTISWFARRLNCDRSNVYDIYKRESIDTKKLYAICEILECNLFELLAEEMRKEGEV